MLFPRSLKHYYALSSPPDNVAITRATQDLTWDFEDVNIDGHCRDIVNVHCFKMFKVFKNGDLADGSLGLAPMIIYPSPLS